MQNSFLTRFTLVTLAVSITIAIGLAYVFNLNHQQVLDNDLVNTAVGQTSGLLAQPVSALNPVTKRVSADQYATISRDAMQASAFQQYARGVRVYWPDGTALYPRGTVPAFKGVSMALAAQNVTRLEPQTVAGERIFTTYVPIAHKSGEDFSGVIAIDFSLDQMKQQNAGEQRFVFLATFGAITIIFLSLVALAAAAQRELNRRQRLADDTFVQTITGIASIVDKRDPYTAGHSRRVAMYSRRLAQELKCSMREIQTIEHAALLHDIGKIGIPDAVLLKPGKLDEHERDIIRFHPEIAGEILSEVEAMREVVPCIVHHHERWDGNGYPRRLKADSIPFGARIIAVADTFDAMTTDRPYRRALSAHAAREELLRGAGMQWDEQCVAGMVRLIDAGSVVPPPPITDEDVLQRSFGQQVQFNPPPIAAAE